MEHNGFQKIKKSGRRMYGPEKILVCGYSGPEHQAFLDFLNEIGLGSIPVIFVKENDSHITLGELLRRQGGSGLGEDSHLKRAVIMSGLTQEDLHLLISAYKGAGLPPQLWATLTPTSENWPIGFLLQELEKEANAMKKLRNK